MSEELRDYISGEVVRNTPEERVVQTMAAQLIEDYGYPKTHLRTHPQWRTRSAPSDTHKTYPLDIAVFGADKCRQEKSGAKCRVEAADSGLFMVVETKRETVKEGMEQLKIYLRLCDAEVGVWFNGHERRVVRKIVEDGRITFQDLPDIPRHHERIEDVGMYRRRDLQVPHNLKLVFRTIRNYLAGNAKGATRDEVLAEQLINLIFCKIYDERFTEPDKAVSFRAGVGEDPKTVHARVVQLFERVRRKYPEVFDADDQIILQPPDVAHVVGALQGFCLIEAERDAVADAFETFVGYALKGAQGQFFTPRNVVQLMVTAADPGPEHTVIDPACGSGGFLTESLRHIWGAIDRQATKLGWPDTDRDEEKRAAALRCIRGIEKDSLLAKVAKSYMAILGDGKGGIFANEDSLADPTTWQDETRRGAVLGTFDVVLANPPFGKDIKVIEQDKLAQYELGHEWKKDSDTGVFAKTDKVPKKGRTVEVLFVERCIQLLKDRGTLGIILPESYFFAPSRRYVAQFLERHNITHLIDLPHNTFRPHNNAKCVAIILKKNMPQQETITMIAAEEMGHDHGGRPLYRTDPATGEITDELWDDVSAATAELTAKSADEKSFVFEVKAEEVRKAKVYVPRYYWDSEKEAELVKRAANQGARLVRVKELLDKKIITTFPGHGSPEARFKGTGDVPYVRVADIVSWDVYLNPTALIPEHVAESFRRSDRALEALDLLYVSRGSYRIGSVALLAKEDTGVVLTREIQVVRVTEEENEYGIDPYYLLYLFSTEIVATQTKNKVMIDTTLPNIGGRWKELLLPIHDDPADRERVRDEVKAIIDAKHQARSQIEDLRSKRALALM